MELGTLIVSVAVLVATCVLIWLGWPRRPHFRLDQMRVYPYIDISGGLAEQGDLHEVTLVFVNDGPGVAPATRAFVAGVLEDRPGQKVQYPADGSPTLAVGDKLEVRARFRSIAKPAHLPWRKYMGGDDYYFDFTKLVVRIEWGSRLGRRSQTISKLHDLQQHASPQLEVPSAEWRVAREQRSD